MIKNLKVIVYRNPKMTTCPQCKEFGTLQRSRAKNMLEQIIKKISFFKYYRCTKCGWRGSMSYLIFTKTSVKTLLFYLFMALLAGYIVRYVLVRFVG